MDLTAFEAGHAAGDPGARRHDGRRSANPSRASARAQPRSAPQRRPLPDQAAPAAAPAKAAADEGRATGRRGRLAPQTARDPSSARQRRRSARADRDSPAEQADAKWPKATCQAPPDGRARPARRRQGPRLADGPPHRGRARPRPLRIRGSGPQGRVIRADVEAALCRAPTPHARPQAASQTRGQRSRATAKPPTATSASRSRRCGGRSPAAWPKARAPSRTSSSPPPSTPPSWSSCASRSSSRPPTGHQNQLQRPGRQGRRRWRCARCPTSTSRSPRTA